MIACSTDLDPFVPAIDLGTPDYDVWMAAAVLSALPPLIIFLVLERQYLRGLRDVA